MAPDPALTRHENVTSEAPLRKAAPWPGAAWPVMFISVMLVLFHLGRWRMMHGDAAVYAQSIERADFFHRAIHTFYYMVGWVFTRVTGAVGIPTDVALIGMGALFTAFALWMVWGLYRDLGIDGTIARWSLAVLGFSGILVQQGIEAEIYSLQISLIVISYRLFLRDRGALAGLLFGAAMLTSPLTVFAGGFFLGIAIRDRKWRPFFICVLMTILTFAVVFALCWREYLYGERGVASQGTSHPPSLSTTLYNFWALGKNFSWMLPLLPVGLVMLVRRRDPLVLPLGFLLLSQFPLFTILRENGVFMLPAYPLLTVAIAVGSATLVELWPSWRGFRGVVYFGLYAATSLFIWLDPVTAAFRNNMLEALARTPAGATVYSSWSFSMALTYYGSPPRGTLLPARNLVFPESMPSDSLAAMLAAGRSIYLMEPHYPSRAARWFYTPSMMRDHMDRHSLLQRLERELPGVIATPTFHPMGGPTLYRLERGLAATK